MKDSSRYRTPGSVVDTEVSVGSSDLSDPSDRPWAKSSVKSMAPVGGEYQSSLAEGPPAPREEFVAQQPVSKMRVRAMQFWLKLRRFSEEHATLTDWSMAIAAVVGMAFSVLLDLPVRADAFAGSDMKTLYASTWNFAHGHNAYTILNIQAVFSANGMVLPHSWFGHAPVYPPTALALLAPLSLLSMTSAVYLSVIGSAALFAIALAALLRYARVMFSVPLAARAGIAAVCASCPLFSFALSMGNVSVVSAALSILSFVNRERAPKWLTASFLAIAIVLKPHLALWMLIGMFLLTGRTSRTIAARAALIVAAFTVAVTVLLCATGTLAQQTSGFFAVLHAETSGGSSMSAASREVLPIFAQITSLHSLVGFWSPESLVQTLFLVSILVALGCLLAWRTLAAHTEAEAVVAVATWSCFGLLVTYHRTHDALILLILLPWTVSALLKDPLRWSCWAVALSYAALCFAPSYGYVVQQTQSVPQDSFLTFALLRQASVASLALLVALLCCARKPANLGTELAALPGLDPEWPAMVHGSLQASVHGAAWFADRPGQSGQSGRADRSPRIKARPQCDS